LKNNPNLFDPAVNYPALQGPEAIAFQRYANKKMRGTGENEGNVEEENMIVAGETEEMEFVSNIAESKRAAKAGCK
jgi:DNA-directed RNA polymerase I subunit RPA49